MLQMGPESTKDYSWENNPHQDSEYDVWRWTEETLDIFRFSPLQKIAHEYQEGKGDEIKLPPEYRPWQSVFKKKASERLPER